MNGYSNFSQKELIKEIEKINKQKKWFNFEEVKKIYKNLKETIINQQNI